MIDIKLLQMYFIFLENEFRVIDQMINDQKFVKKIPVFIICVRKNTGKK